MKDDFGFIFYYNTLNDSLHIYKQGVSFKKQYNKNRRHTTEGTLCYTDITLKFIKLLKF